MSGDRTVIGTFDLTGPPAPRYTLVVNTTGTGTGTVTPSGGTYGAGTEVTLTANPSGDSELFENERPG